jgi:hypothetical protein
LRQGKLWIGCPDLGIFCYSLTGWKPSLVLWAGCNDAVGASSNFMFIKTGLGRKTSCASSSGVGVCGCQYPSWSHRWSTNCLPGEERMGSHIPVATSYLHWQDDGGRCSRIILVSNDFFFIREMPYTTLASCWGALRWGVHGSQFFNAMEVSGFSTLISMY